MHAHKGTALLRETIRTCTYVEHSLYTIVNSRKPIVHYVTDVSDAPVTREAPSPPIQRIYTSCSSTLSPSPSSLATCFRLLTHVVESCPYSDTNSAWNEANTTIEILPIYSSYSSSSSSSPPTFLRKSAHIVGSSCLSITNSFWNGPRLSTNALSVSIARFSGMY